MVGEIVFSLPRKIDAWKRVYVFIWCACCWVTPSKAAGLERVALERFIHKMEVEHGFDAPRLRSLFDGVRFSQKIIDTISRPAESKPWYDYRPIFVTDKRAQAGVDFWRRHADSLAHAQASYGVPPEVIVAIIGVETFYGRHRGGYRVIDALSTLAFNYPKRADFFRSELEHFLLLSREQGVNPPSLHGSYAGAMGLPQFMPSSYRSYAVDFDGDGLTDVWNNPTDAIGSVANYLKVHGWLEGKPVAIRAHVLGEGYRSLLDRGLEPHTSWTQIKDAGVHPEYDPQDDPHALLVDLKSRSGSEYWLGLKNFYVITRYNHSALYAMAVFQLAEAIRSAYREGLRG